MVNSSFDRKIVAGFALALLLAIGALLYRSAAKQTETAHWVAHTHEVLAGIQELILRLTDAETARRGFIMTGHDRYLAHYSNAVERVSLVFGNLRVQTRDDPPQQKACDTLGPLIRQRFAIYAESIDSQLRKGADRDAQLKLTEKGQGVMEQIRTLIAQMDAIERGLLKTRQAASEANLRQTKRFALVGSAASFAMLAWVFALLLRENARRREAEAAIHKVNEQLELRVRQRTAELTQVLAGYQQAEQEIKKLNAELEQRVSERTAQLATANQELEAFSYSVSHDLRAPLRHIGGFIEMLREDAWSVLNDKSRQYLDVIAESGRHMGRLIDSLLDFSRVGRAEMKKTQVNLDGLMQDVLNEVRHDTDGRDIAWEIDPLPTVSGDRSMLRQVWVNLIANAVKYTRPREHARIQIRCGKNGENDWQFSVQDNGAGFDMRYADKLFGVFQRLHSADEFEGTGIGLANVRRIVGRHGGRTWAEGKVNEGATFYFTLPDYRPRTDSGSLPAETARR